jgi:hypothetical protein
MRRYRLFFICLGITALVVGAKLLLHCLDWEVIALGSLHTSVAAGTFFVVGFLLSATIADYKESEKIPAEFAATIENMHEDASAIHTQYPKFNLAAYRAKLVDILKAFAEDVRTRSHEAHHHIHQLHGFFGKMEQANVPPNFIVKLKQEQAALVKSLFRVNYIQRIKFIPSAFILAQAIVGLTIILILFTEIEPFYGGMAIVAIISFILLYILKLIRLISTPFHSEGKTQDDVSLFLVEQTIDRLSAKK